MTVSAPRTPAPSAPHGAPPVFGNHTLRGGGLSHLREHNRAAVLRALLDHGPLSRSQLARLVRLTPTALSFLATELLQNGLISDVAPIAGAPRARGGQAVPLALAAEGRVALAVRIGAYNAEVGLVDIRASVLSSVCRRIDHARWGPQPAQLAAEVARMAQSLLDGHASRAPQVLGVGVGVAGWTDASTGVVRHHAQLGWRDVALASLLQDAFGTRSLTPAQPAARRQKVTDQELPVLVDDQVRAMALAEAWYGRGRTVESLALLYVGAVIGYALVVERRAHRGHRAAAGGLGDLPAPGAASEHTLEDVASETALLREARALPPGTPAARWAKSAASNQAPASSVLVDTPGALDDPTTVSLLSRRARALAPSVAQVVAAYDPEVLLAAGPMARDVGALQVGLLHDAVLRHAPALTARMPAFAPASFGGGSSLIGSAALVLQALFSPPLAAHGDPAARLVRRLAATRRK